MARAPRHVFNSPAPRSNLNPLHPEVIADRIRQPVCVLLAGARACARVRGKSDLSRLTNLSFQHRVYSLSAVRNPEDVFGPFTNPELFMLE